MKKLILSMGILFLGAVATKAQNAPVAAQQAEMTFSKEVHDYGDIKQGGNGDSEFKFTNTGSAPLIISDAKGSCGCTVPEWPKNPIKPGETASIKVHYDTKRVGPINKTVTVTANIEGGTKVIRIKGNVLQPETTGAPVNNTNGAPRNNE